MGDNVAILTFSDLVIMGLGSDSKMDDFSHLQFRERLKQCCVFGKVMTIFHMRGESVPDSNELRRQEILLAFLKRVRTQIRLCYDCSGVL